MNLLTILIFKYQYSQLKYKVHLYTHIFSFGFQLNHKVHLNTPMTCLIPQIHLIPQIRVLSPESYCSRFSFSQNQNAKMKKIEDLVQQWIHEIYTSRVVEYRKFYNTKSLYEIYKTSDYYSKPKPGSKKGFLIRALS